MPKTQRDIDTMFLDVAERVAQEATCLRRKTAAVIAIDREIVTFGYNGAPSGIDECKQRGMCVMIGGHCALCNHAEENAVINAAKYGKSITGATLYTLVEPCLACTRSIINASIRRVVWREGYFSEGHGNAEERTLTQELRDNSTVSWETISMPRS